MKPVHPLIAGLCAAVIATTAEPASAAKLCVDPAKPAKCFGTIQAAVDAAAPGDTVTVAPLKTDPQGYRENVVVSTPSLTIQGKGKAKGSAARERCPTTVLDGCETAVDPTVCGRTSGTVSGTGSGFTIAATGVTIRGFTIRFFLNGILLNDGADDATVRDSCFVSNRWGVFSADGASLDATAMADRLVVERSLFRNTSNREVEVFGNDVVVQRNVLPIAEDGVEIRGDRSRIADNRFETCNDRCITVLGHETTVAGNVINSGDRPIRVSGNNPTVRENEIFAAPVNAIEIICDVVAGGSDTASCTGGLVADNEIHGQSDDRDGIRALGSNLTIAENIVIGVSRSGIHFEGDGGLIEENRVVRSGTQASASVALRVEGSDNRILDNDVRLAGLVGIENVAGDRNLYRGNEVAGSGRSGIWIRAGDANEVVANTVEDNHGEGVNNGAPATNTVIDDNGIEGNRRDVCNDGTVASFTGNAFATGGLATSCVVDVAVP